MNQALERIAGINSAAAEIMKESAARKAETEKIFSRRMQELDDKISQDTEEKLNILKAELQSRTEAELNQARTRARSEILALETAFRDRKEEILQSLIDAVLGKEDNGNTPDL